MLGELPGYYEPFFEMRVIAQTEGVRFDQLQTDIEDQLNQRFVSTATWDLPEWEAELGIIPPAGQPIEQRRAVVRSKMRGYGKFTGRLLKSVAEAYENGLVDVSFDPPTSTFTVRFMSSVGTPPNINDLMAAVEEIKPAHQLLIYQYRYITYNELASMSWNEFQNVKYDKLAR